MLPPAASVSLAMRPTPRLEVPLKSMCSNTWARPYSPSFSSALPTLTHICNATTGALLSSSTTTVRPLSRTVLVIFLPSAGAFPAPVARMRIIKHRTVFVKIFIYNLRFLLSV